MKEGNFNTFDDGLLAAGIEYDVAINTGITYNRAIFKGYKQLNGRKMLCFSTQSSESLIINPSYVCSWLESVTEALNEVTFEQGLEAWELKPNKGEPNG